MLEQFEKWRQKEYKKSVIHISDEDIWKAALQAVMDEAERISDEEIEIPMCKTLYDWIAKELYGKEEKE